MGGYHKGAKMVAFFNNHQHVFLLCKYYLYTIEFLYFKRKSHFLFYVCTQIFSFMYFIFFKYQKFAKLDFFGMQQNVIKDVTHVHRVDFRGGGYQFFVILSNNFPKVCVWAGRDMTSLLFLKRKAAKKFTTEFLIGFWPGLMWPLFEVVVIL
jgi:hypothetical protein